MSAIPEQARRIGAHYLQQLLTSDEPAQNDPSELTSFSSLQDELQRTTGAIIPYPLSELMGLSRLDWNRFTLEPDGLQLLYLAGVASYQAIPFPQEAARTLQIGRRMTDGRTSEGKLIKVPLVTHIRLAAPIVASPGSEARILAVTYNTQGAKDLAEISISVSNNELASSLEPTVLGPQSSLTTPLNREPVRNGYYTHAGLITSSMPTYTGNTTEFHTQAIPFFAIGQDVRRWLIGFSEHYSDWDMLKKHYMQLGFYIKEFTGDDNQQRVHIGYQPPEEKSGVKPWEIEIPKYLTPAA